MDQKLTLGTKVRYGLADLGFALITSAMQFFLLFYYTDVAGINPALAGSALMVGKLTWDASTTRCSATGPIARVPALDGVASIC